MTGAAPGPDRLHLLYAVAGAGDRVHWTKPSQADTSGARGWPRPDDQHQAQERPAGRDGWEQEATR